MEATIIDLPRTIVLFEEAVVVAMYVWLAGHCWKKDRATRGQPINFLYRGRLLFSIGVVLLTFGSAHVLVELYGEHLTIRVPLSGLAMLALAAAWMMSFRFDLKNAEV